MEYQVILDDFQGPLDLLLHLIKEKEMDLQTLELSVITDQYLQYIHMMESSQLEVMSEYLVMAAQLIEMKSKMLLPKEKVQIEDEYQEDPREALIRRLIEYIRYKDVLDEIQEKYEKRQFMLIKSSHNMEEYVIDTSTMIPEGLEVYDLMKAMQKMYQRKMLSRPLDTHISKKDISIEQRSDQIRNYFKVRVNKRVKLDELFDIMGIDLDIPEDAYSLGSWMYSKIEDIPDIGDMYQYHNLVFTIIEVEDRRIKRVKIEVMDSSETETE